MAATEADIPIPVCEARGEQVGIFVDNVIKIAVSETLLQKQQDEKHNELPIVEGENFLKSPSIVEVHCEANNAAPNVSKVVEETFVEESQQHAEESHSKDCTDDAMGVTQLSKETSSNHHGAYDSSTENVALIKEILQESSLSSQETESHTPCVSQGEEKPKEEDVSSNLTKEKTSEQEALENEKTAEDNFKTAAEKASHENSTSGETITKPETSNGDELASKSDLNTSLSEEESQQNAEESISKDGDGGVVPEQCSTDSSVVTSEIKEVDTTDGPCTDDATEVTELSKETSREVEGTYDSTTEDVAVTKEILQETSLPSKETEPHTPCISEGEEANVQSKTTDDKSADEKPTEEGTSSGLTNLGDVECQSKTLEDAATDHGNSKLEGKSEESSPVQVENSQIEHDEHLENESEMLPVTEVSAGATNDNVPAALENVKDKDEDLKEAELSENELTTLVKEDGQKENPTESFYKASESIEASDLSQENSVKGHQEEQSRDVSLNGDTTDAAVEQKESLETCPQIVSSSHEEGSMAAVLEEATSDHVDGKMIDEVEKHKEVLEDLSSGDGQLEVNNIALDISTGTEKTDQTVEDGPTLVDQPVELAANEETFVKEIQQNVEESNSTDKNDGGDVVPEVCSMDSSVVTTDIKVGDTLDDPDVDDASVVTQPSKDTNDSSTEDVALTGEIVQETESHTRSISEGEELNAQEKTTENKSVDENPTNEDISCNSTNEVSKGESYQNKMTLEQEGLENETSVEDDFNTAAEKVSHENSTSGETIVTLETSNSDEMQSKSDLNSSLAKEEETAEQKSDQSVTAPEDYEVPSEKTLSESHRDEACQSETLEDAATDHSDPKLAEKSEESLLVQVQDAQIQHDEHLEEESERLPLTEASTAAATDKVKDEDEDHKEAELSESEQSTECTLVKEDVRIGNPAESLHVAPENIEVPDFSQENNTKGPLEEQSRSVTLHGNTTEAKEATIDADDEQKESHESFPSSISSSNEEGSIAAGLKEATSDQKDGEIIDEVDNHKEVLEDISTEEETAIQKSDESVTTPVDYGVSSEMTLSENHECQSKTLEEVAIDHSNLLAEKSEERPLVQVEDSEIEHDEHLEDGSKELPLPESSTGGTDDDVSAATDKVKDEDEDHKEAELLESEQTTKCTLVKEEDMQIENPAESLHAPLESTLSQENSSKALPEEQSTTADLQGNTIEAEEATIDAVDRPTDSHESSPPNVSESPEEGSMSAVLEEVRSDHTDEKIIDEVDKHEEVIENLSTTVSTEEAEGNSLIELEGSECKKEDDSGKVNEETPLPLPLAREISDASTFLHEARIEDGETKKAEFCDDERDTESTLSKIESRTENREDAHVYSEDTKAPGSVDKISEGGIVDAAAEKEETVEVQNVPTIIPNEKVEENSFLQVDSQEMESEEHLDKENEQLSSTKGYTVDAHNDEVIVKDEDKTEDENPSGAEEVPSEKPVESSHAALEDIKTSDVGQCIEATGILEEQIPAENSQGVPTDETGTDAATNANEKTQELQNVSNDDRDKDLIVEVAASETTHDINLEEEAKRPSLTETSKEEASDNKSTILLEPKIDDEYQNKVELPNDEKSTDCPTPEQESLQSEDHKASTSSADIETTCSLEEQSVAENSQTIIRDTITDAADKKELALENIATETSHEHIEENAIAQVDCSLREHVERLKEDNQISFAEVSTEETDATDSKDTDEPESRGEESITPELESGEITESTYVKEETDAEKPIDPLQVKPEEVKHDSSSEITKSIEEAISNTDPQETSTDKAETESVDVAHKNEESVETKDVTKDIPDCDKEDRIPIEEVSPQNPLNEASAENANVEESTKITEGCLITKEEPLESLQLAAQDIETPPPSRDRETSSLDEESPTTHPEANKEYNKEEIADDATGEKDETPKDKDIGKEISDCGKEKDNMPIEEVGSQKPLNEASAGDAKNESAKSSEGSLIEEEASLKSLQEPAKEIETLPLSEDREQSLIAIPEGIRDDHKEEIADNETGLEGETLKDKNVATETPHEHIEENAITQVDCSVREHEERLEEDNQISSTEVPTEETNATDSKNTDEPESRGEESITPELESGENTESTYVKEETDVEKPIDPLEVKPEDVKQHDSSSDLTKSIEEEISNTDPRETSTDKAERESVDVAHKNEESVETKDVAKDIPDCGKEDRIPIEEVGSQNPLNEASADNANDEESTKVTEGCLAGKEEPLESQQLEAQDIETPPLSQDRETGSLDEESATTDPEAIMDDNKEDIADDATGEKDETPKDKDIGKDISDCGKEDNIPIEEVGSQKPLNEASAGDAKNEESTKISEGNLIEEEASVKSLQEPAQEIETPPLSRDREISSLDEQSPIEIPEGIRDDHKEEIADNGTALEGETLKDKNIANTTPYEDKEENLQVQEDCSRLEQNESEIVPSSEAPAVSSIGSSPAKEEENLEKPTQEEILTADPQETCDKTQEKTADAGKANNDVVISVPSGDSEDNSTIEVDGLQEPSSEEVSAEKINDDDEGKIECALVKEEVHIESLQVADADIKDISSGQDREESQLEEQAPTTDSHGTMGDDKDAKTLDSHDLKEETLEDKSYATTPDESAKEDSVNQVDGLLLEHEEHSEKDSESTSLTDASKDEVTESSLVREVAHVEDPAESCEVAVEDIKPFAPCQDTERSSSVEQILDPEDISSNIITEKTVDATGEETKEAQDIAKSLPLEDDSPNEQNTEVTSIKEDVSIDLPQIAAEDREEPCVSEVKNTNSQEEQIEFSSPGVCINDNEENETTAPTVFENEAPKDEVPKEMESVDVKGETKEEEGYVQGVQMATAVTEASNQERSLNFTAEETPCTEDLNVNKDVIGHIPEVSNYKQQDSPVTKDSEHILTSNAHVLDSTSMESEVSEKNNDQVIGEANSCGESGDKTDLEKIEVLNDVPTAVPTSETLAETDSRGCTETDVQVPNVEKEAEVIIQEAENDQENIKETLTNYAASEDVSEPKEVDGEDEIDSNNHKEISSSPIFVASEEVSKSNVVLEENSTSNSVTELETKKEEEAPEVKEITPSSAEGQDVESVSVEENSNYTGSLPEEKSDSNEVALTPGEDKSGPESFNRGLESIAQVQSFDVISKTEETKTEEADLKAEAELQSDKAVTEDILQEETTCEKEIMKDDISSKKEQPPRIKEDDEDTKDYRQGSCDEEVITDSHQEDEVKQDQKETFEFTKNETETVPKVSEEANAPSDLEEEIITNETIDRILHPEPEEQATSIDEPIAKIDNEQARDLDVECVKTETQDSNKEGVQIAIIPGRGSEEQNKEEEICTSDEVQENLTLSEGKSEEEAKENYKEAYLEAEKIETKDISECANSDVGQETLEENEKSTTKKFSEEDYPTKITECEVSFASEDIALREQPSEDALITAEVQEAKAGIDAVPAVPVPEATGVVSQEVEELSDNCTATADTSKPVETSVISTSENIGEGTEGTPLEAKDQQTKLHDLPEESNMRGTEVQMAEKDETVNLQSVRDISEDVQDQEICKESFGESNKYNPVEGDPEERIETGEGQETKPQHAPVSETLKQDIEEQQLGRDTVDVHEEEKNICNLPNQLESVNGADTEKVPESSIHQSSVEDKAEHDKKEGIDFPEQVGGLVTADVTEPEASPLSLKDKHVVLEADEARNLDHETLDGDKNISKEHSLGEYEVVEPSRVEQQKEECRNEERTDQETERKPEPEETGKPSLSDLLQVSARGTSQMADHSPTEKEPTSHTEDVHAENIEEAEHENMKTDEEKDDEDESHEQKKSDLGSEAPVMVDIGDADMKVAHKKSHNILSGVGSKVKHSIAKVKKAITGKSPSPKKATNPESK